jgi:hypothetical protein
MEYVPGSHKLDQIPHRVQWRLAVVGRIVARVHLTNADDIRATIAFIPGVTSPAAERPLRL